MVKNEMKGVIGGAIGGMFQMSIKYRMGHARPCIWCQVISINNFKIIQVVGTYHILY
jgi:hypothetical protein